MLMIRLQRIGKKKSPSYRLVVSEKTRDTQAGSLEILGTYNPVLIPKVTELKADRIKHWISQGAQLSETVNNLLIKEGVIEGKKMKSVNITNRRQGKINAKKAEVEEKAVEVKAAEEKAKVEEKVKATVSAEALIEEKAEAQVEEKPIEEKVEEVEEKVEVKDETPVEEAPTELIAQPPETDRVKSGDTDQNGVAEDKVEQEDNGSVIEKQSDHVAVEKSEEPKEEVKLEDKSDDKPVEEILKEEKTM